MILLDLAFAYSISDFIAAPLVVVLIYLYSVNYKNRMLVKNKAYEYFVWGISAKIFGAVALGVVYNFYYQGGDTLNYYQTSSTLANLFFKDPTSYFKILFGDTSREVYSIFDSDTDWPFFWNDEFGLFVSRVVSPLIILTGKSFLATSILVGFISFSGIWKLYLIFCEQFPDVKQKLAIGILFMPSVVFWGSGILKDTITLCCVGWYTYAVYTMIVRKKSYIISTTIISVAVFFMISIKPYIFFALLPGTMIWVSTQKITQIKNKVFKFIAAPLLLSIAAVGAIYGMNIFSDSLGVYSADSVLDRAALVNQDLKRDFYKGNSFDIGDFDGTFTGVLLKAPRGVEAALFRPYIWEARNPVMFLSSIENLYILLLSLFLIIRFKFFTFFKHIAQHPLLFFSFLFAIFFAFAVGISISNFGALVRLKIPCIPFFMASIFILKYYYDKSKKLT